MSDIKELLDRAAHSVEATPSAETVEVDLRRGKQALAERRRSRAIRLSLAGPLAAAALIGAVLVASPGGEEETTGPEPGIGAGQVPANDTPVRLVAYDGEQLQGFVVDQIPDGWQLQGSNAFRLTIAPLGDTTSPDSFVGKLVVMLLSSSVHQKLPEGEPVQVGGQNGVVTHANEADTLTYEDGAGHLVQVQAWRSALGLSNDQLARFAEGVQVTADAQAGVG
jgi:hypothetical protein